MEIVEPLYFSERGQWRNWLENNHDKEREAWLVFPKKSSRKKRIPYNDAVEEALCFGWIDSIIKPIDDEKYAQRFSPRSPKSNYSQANIERLRWLSKNKLLHPTIERSVEEIIKKPYVFPADILEEIKKDKKAWDNFQRFSDSYKRIRIAYIDNSRARQEYFKKRLSYFIKKTRENKLIGYGGIDKYY